MAAKANIAPVSPLKGADGPKIVLEHLPIDQLVAYAANARTHPPKQVAQIAASIKEFGFIAPVVVDKNDVLIAGHGRVLAAKELGRTHVPTIRAEHLTDAQVKALRLADNKLTLNSEWLDDLLRDELHLLQGLDFDLSLTGFDDDELAKLLGAESAPGMGAGHAMLADRFMVPPFTVLNAREGWWQDRKRAWIALGIQSELGRGDTAGDGLAMSDTINRLKPSADQALKNAKRAAPGGNHMPATDYSKSGAKGGGNGKALSFRDQDSLNKIMGQKRG